MATESWPGLRCGSLWCGVVGLVLCWSDARGLPLLLEDSKWCAPVCFSPTAESRRGDRMASCNVRGQPDNDDADAMQEAGARAWGAP